MTARKKLYAIWNNVCAVALKINNKRYEGCPITEKWKTFDGFYQDNQQRFYKAQKKWANYKRVTPINKNVKYNLSHINFIRKNKESGYTKKNTVFTSASDRMKYHKTSRKIMIGEKLLGTRDVFNILKKKNINISGPAVIATRMWHGRNPFLDKNHLEYFRWHGENLPLHKIAEIEGIAFSMLKHKVFIRKMPLNKAIDYCKSYIHQPLFLFEGNEMFLKEIFKILSERTGINVSTLNGRYRKLKLNSQNISEKVIERITFDNSDNKYLPNPKKVIAEKGNEKLSFNSIREAANTLGISAGNISTFAHGKRKGKLKGYNFHIESINK